MSHPRPEVRYMVVLVPRVPVPRGPPSKLSKLVSKLLRGGRVAPEHVPDAVADPARPRVSRLRKWAQTHGLIGGGAILVGIVVSATVAGIAPGAIIIVLGIAYTVVTAYIALNAAEDDA